MKTAAFAAVTLLSLCLYAQEPAKPPANQLKQSAPSASCPVSVVELNPSHESFWNNVATSKTVGGQTYSAHNKFLEAKLKNNTSKPVRGVKLVTAYYDSTEDLHTLPEGWGWHQTIKPGETKTGNWENNLWQHKAFIGWVIVPVKVLFEDGSKWEVSDVKACMLEWWKDKKHPRVNQAPNVDGIKTDEGQ